MSRDRRRRPPDRAQMIALASLPHEGRVMRQVRRAFVASGMEPLCMGDFLAWTYPSLERFKHWHRWSVRRALLRYATPIGRSRKQGCPVIWAPRDMTRHGRKTSLLRNALTHD